MKLLKKIKDFFVCVRYTWICKLILTLILIAGLSVYIGLFETMYEKDTWYNTAVYYSFVILVSAVCLFALYFVLHAIWNWVWAKIKGNK